MATIIGVCELGGYLGHISKITAILQQLKRLGHQVIAVLPDMSFVGFMEAQNPAIPYVLGPKLTMPAFKTSRDPVNLSEVLLCVGMGTDTVLTPCANLWRQLFSLLKADLIIADYAPTPLLAARCLGIKTAVLGTGFSVPPQLSPLPAFNRRLVIQDAALQASDTQLLSALNRYLIAQGAAQLHNLSELFWQTELTAITHPQALDHYAHGRPEHSTEYYSLATQLPGGVQIDWPTMEGTKIFAYLKTEYAGLDSLLRHLQRLPIVAVIYISGENARQWLDRQTPRIHISLLPVDLTELVPGADWLIYHAGSGMASQALAAGKPSILIPVHYEQLFTAEALASRQLGYVLNPHWSEEQIKTVLSQALADKQILERCALKGQEQGLGFDELVERIHTIVRTK